jgi:hypothetical protein
MQLDARMLAESTAEIVRRHVATATEPLLKRIEELHGELKTLGQNESLETSRIRQAVVDAAKEGEEVRNAEHRAIMAEQREALAALRLKIEERLLQVKDGKDADEAAIEHRLAERADRIAEQAAKQAVADLPKPKDGDPGKDADMDVLAEVAREAAREAAQLAVDAIPRPKDAKKITPRGLYKPDETYLELDIVALNGGSFIAKCDDPGPCPGEGWMLLTQRGKRGGRSAHRAEVRRRHNAVRDGSRQRRSPRGRLRSSCRGNRPISEDVAVDSADCSRSHPSSIPSH